MIFYFSIIFISFISGVLMSELIISIAYRIENKINSIITKQKMFGIQSEMIDSLQAQVRELKKDRSDHLIKCHVEGEWNMSNQERAGAEIND